MGSNRERAKTQLNVMDDTVKERVRLWNKTKISMSDSPESVEGEREGERSRPHDFASEKRALTVDEDGVTHLRST